MPVKRAIEAYRTRRFNCAQSLLHGFREHHAISDDAIEQARQLGGGRAEGGRCGALHVALELAGDAGARDRLHKAFVDKAGSDQCREIRRSKTLTCEQCIELAASLLAKDPRSEPKSQT